MKRRRLMYLLGAFVAECRGGAKLVVDMLGVFRKLHDITVTSLRR